MCAVSCPYVLYTPKKIRKFRANYRLHNTIRQRCINIIPQKQNNFISVTTVTESESPVRPTAAGSIKGFRPPHLLLVDFLEQRRHDLVRLLSLPLFRRRYALGARVAPLQQVPVRDRRHVPHALGIRREMLHQLRKPLDDLKSNMPLLMLFHTRTFSQSFQSRTEFTLRRGSYNLPI